ncbi:topoisomerase 1-associated factor 1-like [Lacerta agilis]|uniref:topoisomerase 1-associated factor 1-like n=1 Tax=Lacerta agilis TaxID=80427 RepID=UPI00141A61FA|nr:topoisomerase 1-associated factor 1-like [Lacerta agilis]
MIQIERTGEAEREAGYNRSRMADGCADSMQTVDHLEQNLVTEVCVGCEETRQDMKAEEEKLAELEAQLKIQDATTEDTSDEEEEDDDDEDNGMLEKVRANVAQLRVKIEAMSREATELAADLTRCAQQKMVLATTLEEVLKGKQGAHQRKAEPLFCDQKAKRPKEDGGEGDQEVPAPSLLLQEEAAGDLGAEDPSLQEEVSRFI